MLIPRGWPVCLVAWIMVGSCLFCGCKPQDQISSYTVRREAMPTGRGSAPAEPGTPGRTLGAMVLHGGQYWFFKLTGPTEPVAAQRETFQEFVRSLAVGERAGVPSWKLPSGWVEKPGSGLRFATIEVPAEPKPLELTVIPLPNSGQNERDDVLQNVNRWRDQMKLGPLKLEELDAQSERIELPIGVVTLVDIEGEIGASGMSPPFAGGGARPAMPAPPPGPVPPPNAGAAAPPSRPAADVPFKYQVPAGWTPAQGDAFSQLAFSVSGNGQTGRITVTVLGQGAGGVLANVNRWRQQVGLAGTTEAELTSTLKTMRLGSVEAHLVDLKGTDKGLLGAIATQGSSVWFFKFMGDASLVASERERFLEFLGSVQFP